MLIQELLNKYIGYQDLINSNVIIKNISPKIIDEMIEDLKQIQLVLNT